MTSGSDSNKITLMQRLGSIWSWLFLIMLLIFFEIFAEIKYGRSFLLNLNNWQSITLAAVQPLLIAVGQTFVIIAGGIDLSVGFTVGLASVVSASVMQRLDPSLPPLLSLLLASVMALVASMVVGLVNGYLVAKLKVPPFIGTLGMYGVARGIAYLISASPVPVDNKLNSSLGNDYLFGIIPIPVLITIIVLIVMNYVLSQTKFGQYTYAIGGNRQAAIRAGINVDRHTIGLYLLTALLAGLAGLIYTNRFTAGSAIAGEPTLLNSIAAVVIGGASLFGGEGKIVGTLIGALLIAVIEFGLVFINAQPYWQFVLVGVVIILSVLVDQSRKVVNR